MFQFLRNIRYSAVRYKGKVFQKPKKGTKEAEDYYNRMHFNEKAKQQITQMSRNIQANTPRVVAGLIILSSLPTCYYFYQSLWCDYQDRDYYKYIRKYKFQKYSHLRNAFACSVIIGLETCKFIDSKAKNKIPKFSSKSRSLFLLVPIALSTISISYLDVIDKKLVFGTIMGDLTLMMLEAVLSNQGVIPFWYFNIKYQVHIFDVIMLSFIYYSVKHLRNDMIDHPYRYLEEQGRQNQLKINYQ